MIAAERAYESTGHLEALTFDLGQDMEQELQSKLADVIGVNPTRRHLWITDKGNDFRTVFQAASKLPHLEHCSFFGDTVRDYDPQLDEAVVEGFPSLRPFRAVVACTSISKLLLIVSTPSSGGVDIVLRARSRSHSKQSPRSSSFLQSEVI